MQTVNGEYPTLGWFNNCDRQYFCVRLLARRISEFVDSNTNIQLNIKQHDGIGVVENYGSNVLTSYQWVALQNEYYGYCDTLQVKALHL